MPLAPPRRGPARAPAGRRRAPRGPLASLASLGVLLAAGCAPPAPRAPVERAYLVTPLGDAPAALYLVVHNAAATADTLLGVDTPVGTATLHESAGTAADAGHGAHAAPAASPAASLRTMRPLDRVVVPAEGALRLAPGGHHVMVAGLRHPVARGDSVDVVVRLARAGTVRARAAVIGYADVDTATAAAASR